MATLKALQDKIAKLQAQAEAVAKKESSAVFGKIRDLMEKHGLTPDDIAAHFGKTPGGRKSATAAKAGAFVAAKYVDPKTGATWTGRGRAPAWIASAKNRDKFLASTDNTPAAIPIKKTKVGNYARGPQAPKYRDPMSGETWSGRGRAPAWLATAKDRTEYLIEKPAVASAKTESVTAKKTTKKAAVKKAATKKSAAKTATVKKAAVAKSAKNVATNRTAAAKKAASPAKKTTAKKAAVKKAAVKRVQTKTVAAKKTAAVETPTLLVDPGVSSDVTPA